MCSWAIHIVIVLIFFRVCPEKSILKHWSIGTNGSLYSSSRKSKFAASFWVQSANSFKSLGAKTKKGDASFSRFSRKKILGGQNSFFFFFTLFCSDSQDLHADVASVRFREVFFYFFEGMADFKNLLMLWNFVVFFSRDFCGFLPRISNLYEI